MKLFLVRHGETEENVAHTLMGHLHGVLTAKGKQQAKETADALKNYHFDHIYSSDLGRCVDTAKIIKKFHPDAPLTLVQDLRELHMGVLQGQNWESLDIESQFDDPTNNRPEGGESQHELKTRALHFIQELYKHYPKENVLLVTHNGVMTQIISHFAHVEARDIFHTISNAQVFQIEVGPDLSGEVLNFNQ